MTTFIHISVYLPAFSSYLDQPTAGGCLRKMIKEKEGKIFVSFYEKAVPLYKGILRSDELLRKLLVRAIELQTILPKKTKHKFEKVVENFKKEEKKECKKAEKQKKEELKAKKEFKKWEKQEKKAYKAAKKEENKNWKGQKNDNSYGSYKQESKQESKAEAQKPSQSQENVRAANSAAFKEIMNNTYYQKHEQAKNFEKFAAVYDELVGCKELTTIADPVALKARARLQLTAACRPEGATAQNLTDSELTTLLKKLRLLAHVDKAKHQGITDEKAQAHLGKLWNFLRLLLS